MCLDGRPCLIGGTDDRHVYGDVRTFRAETQDWEEEAELKDRRAFHASALHDGSVWVAGGFNGDEILSSVESLRPGAASWQPQSPLSMARMGDSLSLYTSSLCTTASKLVSSLHPLAHHAFVTRSIDFTQIAALHEPCGVPIFHRPQGQLSSCLNYSTLSVSAADRATTADHAMVQLEGRVYVLGGSNLAETLSRSVEVFNAELGFWEASLSLSTGRRRFTAHAFGGRIWVFGGQTIDGELTLGPFPQNSVLS